jgi:hypothetical protein
LRDDEKVVLRDDEKGEDDGSAFAPSAIFWKAANLGA